MRKTVDAFVPVDTNIGSTKHPQQRSSWDSAGYHTQHDLCRTHANQVHWYLQAPFSSQQASSSSPPLHCTSLHHHQQEQACPFLHVCS